jgi:hypothetical protein
MSLLRAGFAGLLGLLLATFAAGQSFAYTHGPMQQARAGQAAVVLKNGKVLLIGGGDRGKLLASAELYDPATETFTATGSMSTPRLHPEAQLLPNGDVLVMGGQANAGATNGPDLSSEIYDPAMGTFSEGPKLGVSLGGIVSTVLKNGRIFLAGVAACDNGAGAPCPAPIYLFDPETGTFAQAGALAIAAVAETATTLENGTVLLFEGLPQSMATSPLNSFQIYDPATGKTTVGSATEGLGVAFMAAARLQDGSVLICGGNSHFSSAAPMCQLYDPASRTARLTTGTMHASRLRPTATLLQDGRVLIAGGNRNVPSLASPPDAEIYDPQLEAFRSAGNLETTRYEFTASLLADGSVLIAGGYPASYTEGDLGSGAALASAELFTPPAPAPDFGLFANRQSGSVDTLPDGAAGGGFQISARGSHGFSGPIALSCSGGNRATGRRRPGPRAFRHRRRGGRQAWWRWDG